MSKPIGPVFCWKSSYYPIGNSLRSIGWKRVRASDLLVEQDASKDREHTSTWRPSHLSLLLQHRAMAACAARVRVRRIKRYCRCIATSEICLVQMRLEVVVVDSEVSLLLPRARIDAARIIEQQRCQGVWRQKRHWLRLVDALVRQPRLCSLPNSSVRLPPCLLRH